MRGKFSCLLDGLELWRFHCIGGKSLCVGNSSWFIRPAIGAQSSFIVCVSAVSCVYCVPIVDEITDYFIVGVITLSYIEIRIYIDLKDVPAWLHTSYINPLAVYIISV